MNKIIWSIALSASLLSGIANATVEGFIKAGYSMEHVIAHGLVEGLSIEETVVQALAVAPDKADAIIAAAVAAKPDKAQAIVDTAAAAGINPEQVVAAAIAGGADPSSISPPTAAGSALASAALTSAALPGGLPPLPPFPPIPPFLCDLVPVECGPSLN